MRSVGVAVVVACSAVVLPACDDGDGERAADAPTAAAAPRPARGGTLVIGAEQEPACADWVGRCAGASWGVWTMQAHTMPRSFDVDPESLRYRPSPLLADEPELDPGPPMTVTYRIRPEAVWSDGTPITSADYRYTWQAITSAEDAYDSTGYDLVTGVDDSDPTTAVVTFRAPYAAWRDLFGGHYGILPRHLLEGHDRHAAMKDGYGFSGGAWRIEHWKRGEEVRLVPNERYWEDRPHLDAVVFRFINDAAGYQQAFRDGNVAAIHPQPRAELAQLEGVPGAAVRVATGLNFEALWFNTARPPLDDVAFRTALAHATDRGELAQQVFGSVPARTVRIDALTTSANRQWHPDSRPFARYRGDRGMVEEIMTTQGWHRGADGIWARGDQRAVIDNVTTEGSVRRHDMQELLAEQWRAAGFELRPSAVHPDRLFQEIGPLGEFATAIWSMTPPSPDPGACALFCSAHAPVEANGFSGQNWSRLVDAELDALLAEVDTALDERRRRAVVSSAHRRLAERLPVLPLAALPDVLIFDERRLNGPIGHNFVYGPFWNVHRWWCTEGSC